ncbi:MAG: peptide chain release factor N(5)-glutamine methyltransferase [Tenericutes bacterium]|nr:peptide chain release factor N(5)-glutamine methyltransferase [Mycoplasmatota bacterium]
MTYEALLKIAYKKTNTHNKEEEAAKLLLMELSNQEPHQFFTNLKSEVPKTLEIDFLNKLDQYLVSNIPVQHLIGHSYFYGYKFKVNQHVLIPRGETEQLVEHVLYYYDKYFIDQKIIVLDLGTGSGCIGIALSLEEENMNVTVSDISEEALKVAKDNQHDLKANVKIIQSDLFENISDAFDIIVSNPPYIPDTESVQDIVSKEPKVALYGGLLGVDFYEKIITNSKNHLKEHSLIAFEHGFQQKQRIFEIAKKHFPNAHIVQVKDLAGKDRFTFIGLGNVLDLE